MKNNRLQLFCIYILIFNFSSFLMAQVPSVIEKIRIPLWAEMDIYPGIDEYNDSDNLFDYSVKQIKNVCPYLLEGMIYGWDFVYTPADSERNVSEYFELVPKVDPDFFYKKINYVKPIIEDNKLVCWCEYSRTSAEIQNYYLWTSIQNPRLHGNGYGPLQNGVIGIKEAVEDATKNAIREHYRGFVKNKPKEINGAILIKEVPVLGLDAGRYLVKLDFLLEYGKIIEYVQF